MTNTVPDGTSNDALTRIGNEISSLRNESHKFVSSRELYLALLAFLGVVVGLFTWIVSMQFSNHVEIVTQRVVAEVNASLGTSVTATAADTGRLVSTTRENGERLAGLEANVSELAEAVSNLNDEVRNSDILPSQDDVNQQGNLRPPFEPTQMSDGGTTDIVDTVLDAGNFTTLVAAVEASGLVDTLKGEGPYTLFAPTDEAFEALPDGTVERLLSDPEALAAILSYHVVPGKVMSTDLNTDMTAATVNGADITVMTEGGVMVNDASVTVADIEASNGVVHVIDKVILPPF